MESIADKPDIESSTEEYARRFAGPTGAWMLRVQERCAMALAQPYGPALTILDVGGGHAQLAPPLAHAGHRVTVLGSTSECAQRLQPWLDRGACAFQTGSLTALPFDEATFDLALAFRMLTHCPHWEQLVAELCRVARRAVIVDYPTSQSVNKIAPWLFEAKKKVEQNTRVWHPFRHEEIESAFAAHEYQMAGRRKQFFFPMVIHRLLKCRLASTTLEGVARGVGLTALAGSPVVVAFERKEGA